MSDTCGRCHQPLDVSSGAIINDGDYAGVMLCSACRSTLVFLAGLELRRAIDGGAVIARFTDYVMRDFSAEDREEWPRDVLLERVRRFLAEDGDPADVVDSDFFQLSHSFERFMGW